MTYRIFEIIRIIEEMAVAPSAEVSAEVMVELMGEGYRQDEIEEAISWIEVYRNQSDSENLIEITSDYKTSRLTSQAFRYLKGMVEREFVSEEYFDEILNYCMISSEKTITLDDILKCEKMARMGRNEWTDEAMANYKAYTRRKDC